MLLPMLSVLSGLALLFWSADLFVDGAAASARHFGLPPLLIGMVVVGFGTSAPEMVVSAISSYQGNPGLALGNAYGSNITNIALILGVTALIRPITVHSRVLWKELPILAAVTALAVFLLRDGAVTRWDAAGLLLLFAALMTWAIREGLVRGGDPLGEKLARGLEAHTSSLRKSLLRFFLGLALLVLASRVLVWGAVAIARALGVSDIVIGLTVVAVGTSLPELASSIVAARRGDDEIVLGNVIGSNLFNTLAVVGIAGVIHPIRVDSEVLWRDAPVMGALTVGLFVLCYFGRRRIGRLGGALLLAAYPAYAFLLLVTTAGKV